jgi:hypothetical protein
MQYKVCKLCGVEKPLSENYFYKHSKTKSGYLHVCIECQKSKSKKQWEKIKSSPILHAEEKQRQRRLKNNPDVLGNNF